MSPSTLLEIPLLYLLTKQHFRIREAQEKRKEELRIKFEEEKKKRAEERLKEKERKKEETRIMKELIQVCYIYLKFRNPLAVKIRVGNPKSAICAISS